MNAWSILTEVVFLLAACLVGGAVFARLKQSPIPGYLIAGMLVGGPGSFGLVRSQSHIEAIAELGVALLLFGLGLEFSLARLRRLGKAALLGGGLQVLVTLAAVALTLLVLGSSMSSAVTIGAMLALSSTAVVLRVLTVHGELDSRYGRATIAVLLVQDVALVPLAVLVTALGEGGGAGATLLRVGETLGLSVLLMVALYVAITHGVMPFIRRMDATRNREFSVLLAVVIGLGSTALAHAVGLSPALGAVLAGMFLGSSPMALQLRADVSSIRTVLLTLFFGAVGMVADPLWIFANLGQVLLVAVVVLVAKVGLALGALRMVGTRVQEASAAALCLSQVGEFAFVLGAIGLANGTVDDAAYGLVVSVSIVSLMVAPYLIHLAPRFGTWVGNVLSRGRAVALDELAQHHHDVVVIGFGPAGRGAVRGLDLSRVSVCVIDLNERSLGEARELGYDALLGDATREEILAHAGVVSARIVVITPPSPSLCRTLMDLVHGIAPDAHCLVRARHDREVGSLERAGATRVVSDESEVGTRLGVLVQELLASPPAADA